MLRRRRRRDVEIENKGDLQELEAEVDENLTIEVFTGLYVNEDEEVSSQCTRVANLLIVTSLKFLKSFKYYNILSSNILK